MDVTASSRPWKLADPVECTEPMRCRLVRKRFGGDLSLVDRSSRVRVRGRVWDSLERLLYSFSLELARPTKARGFPILWTSRWRLLLPGRGDIGGEDVRRDSLENGGFATPSSGIDSGVTARMVEDEYGGRGYESVSSRRSSCEPSGVPIPFLLRLPCLDGSMADRWSVRCWITLDVSASEIVVEWGGDWCVVGQVVASQSAQSRLAVFQVGEDGGQRPGNGGRWASGACAGSVLSYPNRCLRRAGIDSWRTLEQVPGRTVTGDLLRDGWRVRRRW
jgi:hypothetical protein